MTAGPAKPFGPWAAEGDAIRYGVFLRPSPALIDESLRAFLIGERHFGLTAAAAYPPHITLVGSIALSEQSGRSDEVTLHAAEELLISAVENALDGQLTRQLTTTGLAMSEDGFVGLRFADHPDSPAPLSALMGEILEAARPLRHFPLGDRTREHRMKDSPETFAPHLTYVGHDGASDLALARECFEVLQDLGCGAPEDWAADTVTAYRLTSQDWSGEYWRTLRWTPLKSWRLG